MRYNYVMFYILIYIGLTFGEYIIHKYVMHNKEGSIIRRLYGDSHVMHHLDVMGDMTLKDDHNEEGLYFSIQGALLMSMCNFIVFYTIRLLLDVDLRVCTILLISGFIACMYGLLWNNIHCVFHKMYGDIDSYNFYVRWSYKNHAYHHLQKGDDKGNYNIILPGADQILGAYRTCINNVKYCATGQVSPNNKALCELEKRREEMDHGLKFCATKSQN